MRYFMLLLLLPLASWGEEPEVADIRMQLMDMLSVDQEIRANGVIDEELLIKKGNEHVLKLENIIKELGGWPTPEKVGQEASLAAFFIALHSPDRNFKIRVMEMLRPLIKKGSVPSKQYAYLYDKTYRPQRFGTQGECVSEGVWEVFPVEDPENLNARRAQFGMIPFEEYQKLVATQCTHPKK